MEIKTLGSLFSGIGGIDAGAEKEGIQTLWACEINPYRRSIFKSKFPNTLIYEDVEKLSCPLPVDILAGGFPCQDISLSGRGAGLAGGRSSLWYQMLRIAGEIRPRYILVENVPALLIRGMRDILSGIAGIGYNAEWQCISNYSFGFPHARRRLYIIAYPDQIGQKRQLCGPRIHEPVFRPWASNTADGQALSQRVYALGDAGVFRAGNGVCAWVDRASAIGDSCNPVVSRYLFSCIKLHASHQS